MDDLAPIYRDDHALIPCVWRRSGASLTWQVVAHALVDRADVPLLAGSVWHVSRTYRRGAPFTAPYRNAPELMPMPRLLLGLPAGGRTVVPDHINGDPLDNRRRNLRPVTQQQNAENRPAVKRAGASRFRGVSPRSDGRWVAYIIKSEQVVWQAIFDDEEAAGRAVAAARAQIVAYSREASLRTSI